MIKLVVYFDEPFWVGVFENTEKNLLSTCRIVFGSEPKDYDVYEFVAKNFFNLTFGKGIPIAKRPLKKTNPKRIHRQISKELKQKTVSTKSQQAIALAQESRKIERKTVSKEQKEAQKLALFLQRQAKKKQKKKGH